MIEIVNKIEKLIYAVLMILLIVVLAASLVGLLVSLPSSLSQIIFPAVSPTVSPTVTVPEISPMLLLLGSFLLVLIGVELLDTIKAYFVENTIHVEISHILSAIGRLPSSRKTNDLVQLVQNLFYAQNVGHINDLCSLAPKWPAQGNLFPRNTEYPFQQATAAWLAPCDPEVFTQPELNRFDHLAKAVVAGAGKIVSVSER